ncbi:MAG: hypothetical protein JXA22_07450 [Candidatus Thermoplasmatota archaeon]|nr:hypothetical protein [Candidatus Thermoplasmatota archaeon]
MSLHPGCHMQGVMYMLSSKRVLSILLTIIMVAGSLLVFIQQDEAVAEAAPVRAGLYKHSESMNVTFAKPTFYGDTDPNNNNKYVGNNTWEDIAFVIFFQDQHTSTVSVSSNTVTIANVYQSVFVELDNETVTTGTDETILMEDFTATWCPYCTSIIGSMDRLDHDEDWFPEKYIGVEFHGSGTYGNTIGTSRKNDYCSSSGIPTWIIDGVDATIGGGTSPNNTATDNSIKSKINNRISTSAFNITARAGYTSTQAWVDFSFTIEDQNYDNIMVDCNVLLIQHAYPRRHGYDPNAYLGWIGQDMKSPAIFQSVVGSPPAISGITPGDGSLLSGTVDIGFSTTDPDASDDKIVSNVAVRPVGGIDWVNVKKSGSVYPWNTAAMSGDDYIFPDGDYEIRITAKDYWDEESTVTIGVTVLNPDTPIVSLNDQLIQDQFDDGMIEGEFDIIWLAEDDEDGSDVSIDLYYMRSGMEWTPIAEGIGNVGRYTWDTSDPRVPDNDGYILMIRATDSDIMSAEDSSNFGFEINNPDPPTLQITSPREGQELSGKPTIRWTAEDDEDTTAKLTVEISISEDGGEVYSSLTPGSIPNTGSYQFDTTYFDDGTNYKVNVKITDTSGLYAEAGSDIFSIYNNDVPECRIQEPHEEDVVSETITVEWTSSDQEDGPGEMTYDLYYMFSGGTYWKELAIGEPNTGSFQLDTLDLEEGDGVYTLRLLVRDSRGELSSVSTVYFTVYNPNEPEIVSASGPTSTIAKAASFTWYAEDADPGETDGLKVWFYYLDGADWVAVADGIPNTGAYTLDVSGFEDGTYTVKMVVSDCQPGDRNRSAEHLFPDITVDNNDPPTLEMTSPPDPNVEHEGTIVFSWSGSDPEGDKLYYTAYYHLVGDSGWSMVPGAFKISTSSFTWDISLLPAGDYELRLVAVEDTRDGFETEITTTSFRIKEKEIIVDDDDDDDIAPVDDDDQKDNMGLILGIVVGIVVLMIIILVAAALVIISRRKAEANQLPPPGGVPMMQPGAPLPPPVDGGQLPSNQPPQELPPAPTQPSPGMPQGP